MNIPSRTLACPFIKRSRTIHKLWLVSLKNLLIDRSQFRLVMLDMANDPEITAMMKAGIGDGWAEVIYLDNPSKELPPVAYGLSTKDADFFVKRRSIAETMRLLNSNRVGDLVIYEDDIILPPNAFNELSKYLSFPDVLAVTGVNYSRSEKFNFLLCWDWFDGKPRPRQIESERAEGFEYIGSSATGFYIVKEEFIKTYDYQADGTYGQDIVLGKNINKKGKLLLVWNIKYPHIAILQGTNKFKIYKTQLCKTEVLDEYGTAL